MEINSNVKELQYSLIRILKEEATRYPNSIDLTIGEPDIPTPDEIITIAMEYGKNNQLKYALSGGGDDLCTLVANYYNEKYKSNFSKENVLMTIGATEALSTTLRTILNPDDEVILFTPYYPGYVPMIKLCNAKPVYIDISINNFKITEELLTKALTNKTKAILLSNPCNPTGNVLSLEEMLTIVKFVENNDVFLISDEIYNALSFYNYYSFSEFQSIKEKVIIINGFSKSHSMTGWRMGYILSHEKYRKYLLNTSFYTVSSTMSLSLQAAKVALEKYDNRKELADIYRKRAEYMYIELTKIGYIVLKPKGAFYIYANYSKISDLNSFDFAMDLLRKCEVAVVPGISFGTEKYIRIALTVELKQLEEAIKKIKKYN